MDEQLNSGARTVKQSSAARTKEQCKFRELDDGARRVKETEECQAIGFIDISEVLRSVYKAASYPLDMRIQPCIRNLA